MPILDLSRARWRKSSRSTAGNNACCVEVAMVDATWRKSSRSTAGNDAACVEVAFGGPGAALRDSKNPAGPALVLPGTAWRRFLAAARQGSLDVG
jgi:hypothetical protein